MSKTTNIIYYVRTVLLSASFLFAAYSEIVRQEAGIAVMAHLGYPVYLLTILGVAKFLGVIGIWQKFSPTLREWAYAGITFDLLGAIVSTLAVGDGLMGYAPALISLIVVAVSYFTMRKRSHFLPSAGNSATAAGAF